MARHVLALDFGASSGRAILASYDGTAIQLQEAHRFINTPIEKDGKLYWDLPKLMQDLECGLQKAYAIAPYESIGIDTWGVDYGMLDENGALLENPRHYRNSRSAGYAEKFCAQMSAETLYQRTGTQIIDINTLFQLMSQRDQEGFSHCKKLLPMPDLLAYLLTGTVSAERSIASTTQMLSAQTGTWDLELLKAAQIPADLLPEIVESGTRNGVLTDDVQKRLSLPPIAVTAVCGHDTQCAALAAPVKTDKHIFLNCGTWSLFGTESDTPILTPQAAALGLSNEIGYEKKVTFLKNIIGLWLIQETQRELQRCGQMYRFSEIEELAVHSQSTPCAIDPDDPRFTPPGDIPGHIQSYCRETDQPVPETIGAIFRCIYESLAMKYRSALEEVEACTGETYPVIHLVGGGAKDRLLCQLTADYCQRPVIARPAEATVYGNAAIQLMAIGAMHSAEEARHCIAASETMKTYTPEKFPEMWYRMLQAIRKQER
ncbi:MAG: rhamnulokinase [Ruminococcus sp.]|nr:rhamnulokinase [Ruminococcus sp.]